MNSKIAPDDLLVVQEVAYLMGFQSEAVIIAEARTLEAKKETYYPKISNRTTLPLLTSNL